MITISDLTDCTISERAPEQSFHSSITILHALLTFCGTRINTTNGVFTCTIFNLNLSIGDGSVQGNATTGNSMTYNINIQEGTDSALIVPDELKSFTGQALISFDTATEKNKILVRGNLKKEGIDMILLYTNLDTLEELTRTLSIAMDIQKE
jgi:hypothetical protein